MENAHQPSCRANLLASLLTYQLHQVICIVTLGVRVGVGVRVRVN